MNNLGEHVARDARKRALPRSEAWKESRFVDLSLATPKRDGISLSRRYPTAVQVPENGF